MVSITELPTYIIAIVVIGILAGVGILLQDTLKESMDITDDWSVTNETVTNISSTVNRTLTVGSANNITINEITNATDGYDVNLNVSCYTLQPTSPYGGVYSVTTNIILLTTPCIGWEGSDVNISYSGDEYNSASNTLTNSTIGISNITEQIPTVGTVVGIAVLIGIVMLLFIAVPRRREY